MSQNEVFVLIPKDDSHFPFTCFAEGSFKKIEDIESDYKITFDNDDVLILFFHFKNHRRLYVTLPKEKISLLDNKSFWNVTKNRQVLAELRGRNFDRLKHSIDFIKQKTEGSCFNFPVAFWSQIIMLVQQNKHSKLNLNFLCDYYSVLKNYN